MDQILHTLSHKVVTLTLKNSFGVVHILKVPIFKYVECDLRVKVSLLCRVSTLVTYAQKHYMARTLSLSFIINNIIQNRYCHSYLSSGEAKLLNSEVKRNMLTYKVHQKVNIF